ncbi:hypothetical protein [Symmachiella macrocystis]|nr:hypothetical protein [Symmachiella macrocystis]
MTKKRAATERQLENAKQALAAREATLKETGVETKRDTIWRGLNATVRDIDQRLKAIGTIEEREKAMAERRMAPANDSASEE